MSARDDVLRGPRCGSQQDCCGRDENAHHRDECANAAECCQWTPPTAEPAGDVETLAHVLYQADWQSELSLADHRNLARVVLASDWLAAERAKAKAEALERVADDFATDWATEVGWANAAGIEDWLRSYLTPDSPREAQDGGGER